MKKSFLMGMLSLGLGLFTASGILVCGENEPVEQWVKRYSGPGYDWDLARAMAVDSEGNVYVTGGSYGSDTNSDYATIKYDSSGNQLWVARYDGPGSGNDEANSIAVDSSGNVYVTGCSWGSGYGNDYATIKYDSSGNQLWVARFDGGGCVGDAANSLAVDTSGNVYVTGEANKTNTGYWGKDYATVKYDSSGNQLWVARYDGTGNNIDRAFSIAVDNAGNVYVTGDSVAQDSHTDSVTVKYDNSGKQLWAARYDGSGNDFANSIAVDISGNVYVTGYGWVPGTGSDYVTIKYDSSGNQLWLARFDGGGCVGDAANSLALDSFGNVYVTGEANKTNTGYWSKDYGTVKYDNSGNRLWVARYDGPRRYIDRAFSIAVDNVGNVYVTGDSVANDSHTDFATVKYDSSGNQLWAVRYDGGGNYVANSIAVDISGNVYVTGYGWAPGTANDYVTIKYSQFVNVQIDIKPGSYPNSINLGSNGNVPVAIFSTLDFDATTVNPETVSLAGATVKVKGKGTPMAFGEDVDGDGLIDLVVHVDTTALELTGSDTDAILEGQTYDGVRIRGTDTVRIVQD
jgi:hypothetical protein